MKFEVYTMYQIFMHYLDKSQAQKIKQYDFFCVGPVAQSVLRLVTGWTVWGSNPDGGEIFRTCPDRPWVPPSLLYNGYRVFPGGRMRPERVADPSPPSSAEV
jgi:hypothetical protein